MINKSKIFSVLLYIILTLFVPFNLQAITVGTYSAPPFSMHEDGEDIGLATEAIRDLLTKAGVSSYRIVNYPLARGMSELNSGHIDIFYPYISSSSSKQENYTLIGPIAKYQLALFVAKDNNVDISLKKTSNLVLAAERGGLSNAMLEQNSLRLELTTDKLSCLRMALAQRVSACAVGKLPGMYTSALNSIYDQMRFVMTDLSADIYLAVGPSVSSEQLKKLQDTYAKLKQEKYFEHKQRDYEAKFDVFIKNLS